MTPGFRIVLVCAAVFALLAVLAGDATVAAFVGAALLLAGLALIPIVGRLEAQRRDHERAAAMAAEAAAAAAASRQREMLETIAHDLRTPLASMQGYLELLLLRHGNLDSAEAHNYLQTAVRHSERLSRRVADVLELARLESGERVIDAEPFPLAELAHDVAQRYGASAQRARVALEVRADAARGAGPIVLAEVALVERVIGNLVENALRHTPCGGRVTIEIEPAPGHARLAVADTGEGIRAADIAAAMRDGTEDDAFGRYRSASRIGDHGAAHAGLGLAIARRIAVLHGSRLELASRPGAGTRVALDLPLAAARGAHAPRRNSP